ncbi:MAG TPA: hypothetical protein VGO85_03905 [Caldimonas sp.]|jgi:hypothetical protein|nr:hypothetical protein [Caldimonas sp.]
MNTTALHPLLRVLPNKPAGPMRVPARALGWFSIGLGLAELAMPRKVARAAGMPNVPTLTRAYGLREIGTGIGILTSRDPAPWLWGRVAGDALDIATVGTGLLTQRRPLRTLTSLAMLLGIACIDMKVADKAPPEKKRAMRSSRDYGDRSGFPRPASEMRGIATKPSMSMREQPGVTSADGARVAAATPRTPAATYP